MQEVDPAEDCRGFLFFGNFLARRQMGRERYSVALSPYYLVLSPATCAKKFPLQEFCTSSRVKPALNHKGITLMVIARLNI